MTDNQLLQIIADAVTAQGNTWSQGLSFLAGLLCASAFVWASLKEW